MGWEGRLGSRDGRALALVSSGARASSPVATLSLNFRAVSEGSRVNQSPNRENGTASEQPDGNRQAW